MKIIRSIFLGFLLMLATITAVAEQDTEQWIFLFKIPQATVKKISDGHYRLSIQQLEKTEIYMLNDRPFYLIRKINRPKDQIWKDMKAFHMDHREKVKAILFYGNAAHEVFLSDYRWRKGEASYVVQPATINPVNELESSEIQFFMNVQSKPLCNLVNEQHHAQLELG